MDLNYRYAIARQQQLLSDATRARRDRSPIAIPTLALWARRRSASPVTQAAPCPTC